MSLGIEAVQCSPEADVKTDQRATCFLRGGKSQNSLTTSHLKLPGFLALYCKTECYIALCSVTAL